MVYFSRLSKITFSPSLTQFGSYKASLKLIAAKILTSGYTSQLKVETNSI